MVPVIVGLGSDFGIVRGPSVVTRVTTGLDSNLVALTALDEAKTKIDLPTLIKRLYTPIQNLEDDLGQGMKF